MATLQFKDLPLFPHLKTIQIGEVERVAEERGFSPLMGVDEAGRGPWAGPVVAAAVVFPRGALPPELDTLNDSKQMSKKRRISLVEPIKKYALAVGVGQASAQRVDEINVLQATFEAMRAAIANALDQQSDQEVTPYILVDGTQKIPLLLSPQRSIIKGDARSFHIAAASIIAKVVRDQLMCIADQRYPEYGFKQHKGYGTKAHQAALQAYGPCPLHRMSFKPVKVVRDNWKLPEKL